MAPCRPRRSTGSRKVCRRAGRIPAWLDAAPGQPWLPANDLSRSPPSRWKRGDLDPRCRLRASRQQTGGPAARDSIGAQGGDAAGGVGAVPHDPVRRAAEQAGGAGSPARTECGHDRRAARPGGRTDPLRRAARRGFRHSRVGRQRPAAAGYRQNALRQRAGGFHRGDVVRRHRLRLAGGRAHAVLPRQPGDRRASQRLPVLRRASRPDVLRRDHAFP